MDAGKSHTHNRALLYNLHHFSFAFTHTLIRSFQLQFPEWEFPEDWISLSVLMAQCFQPSAYIRTKHTLKSNNTINVLSSLTDKVQWSSLCMHFNFTEQFLLCYLHLCCASWSLFFIFLISVIQKPLGRSPYCQSHFKNNYFENKLILNFFYVHMICHAFQVQMPCVQCTDKRVLF